MAINDLVKMLLCTGKCVCGTDKVFRVRIPRLQGMGVLNFCQNYTCANVKNFTAPKKGDTVIIMAYGLMTEEEVKTFKPAIIFPNNNRV